MTERGRTIAAAWLLGLLGLAACGGGSGSTGLVTSEGAILDEVRRDGTCAELDGTTYCGTDSPDAVAPGGQSVTVSNPAQPTGTPQSAPTPTPQFSATAQPTNGGGSATPVATPAGATATPTPAPTPVSGGRTVRVEVEGFGPDTACAVAARAAGSEDPWSTGPLVVVEGDADSIVLPIPASVARPSELALLCFTPAPATLPPTLATLADADPTVVFALPSS